MNQNQEWWHKPVFPAFTGKVETGGSRIQGLSWLHSSDLRPFWAINIWDVSKKMEQVNEWTWGYSSVVECLASIYQVIAGFWAPPKMKNYVQRVNMHIHLNKQNKSKRQLEDEGASQLLQAQEGPLWCLVSVLWRCHPGACTSACTSADLLHHHALIGFNCPAEHVHYLYPLISEKWINSRYCQCLAIILDWSC